MHRQEKRIARVNPLLVIRGETAGWNHAVNMRVKLQGLTPRVEHAQETNLGTQMLGIGGDFQQRGGTGPEQQIVEDPLIMEDQSSQLVRQGEDHVHVGRRQQFSAAGGQPVVPCIGLALAAMAVTAGIERIRGGLIATETAPVPVASERSRAAALDGRQHFQVQTGQPGSVAIDEALAYCANDVGHLERWPVHPCAT
jgi:hypothetical protein